MQDATAQVSFACQLLEEILLYISKIVEFTRDTISTVEEAFLIKLLHVILQTEIWIEQGEISTVCSVTYNDLFHCRWLCFNSSQVAYQELLYHQLYTVTI